MDINEEIKDLEARLAKLKAEKAKEDNEQIVFLNLEIGLKLRKDFDISTIINNIKFGVKHGLDRPGGIGPSRIVQLDVKRDFQKERRSTLRF